MHDKPKHSNFKFTLRNEELDKAIKELEKLPNKTREDQLTLLYYKIRKNYPLIISIEETGHLYIYDEGVFRNLLLSKLKAYIKQQNNHHLSLSHSLIEIIRNELESENLVSLKDIDSDPTIINCKNGLYSTVPFRFPGIETNFIRHDEYQRAVGGSYDYYLSFVQIPIEYNSEIEPQYWDTFIAEVFGKERVNDVYEMIAYMLMSHVEYQKAILLYGIAGTGKTTFIESLVDFLGVDNCSQVPLHKLNRDFRLYNLNSKLLNFYDDLPSFKLKDISVFKQIVTNRHLSSNIKYVQEEPEWINKTKLLYSCNFLPTMEKGFGEDFYRRWIILDCNNNFSETEKEDKKMGYKLTQPKELSGLFNRIIEAWKRLEERGDFRHEFAKEDDNRDIWHMDASPVQRFIKECCIIGNYSVDKDDFVYLCSEFRKLNGFAPLKKKACTQALNLLSESEKYEIIDTKKLGSKKDGHRKRIYYGFKFNDEWEEKLKDKPKTKTTNGLFEHLEELEVEEAQQTNES